MYKTRAVLNQKKDEVTKVPKDDLIDTVDIHHDSLTLSDVVVNNKILSRDVSDPFSSDCISDTIFEDFDSKTVSQQISNKNIIYNKKKGSNSTTVTVPKKKERKQIVKQLL